MDNDIPWLEGLAVFEASLLDISIACSYGSEGLYCSIYDCIDPVDMIILRMINGNLYDVR